MRPHLLQRRVPCALGGGVTGFGGRSERGSLPGCLPASDVAAQMAGWLAPFFFLQRDEWFPLDRVVAVLPPTRRVIAYHLLWRDDVHGSWIPFTVPTDEEIVWIG